ncbi:MAG: CBS domain-containing protein [Candidatus Woesearchaeota archaeon]|jgi:predicted transcriptional regulator
MGKGSVLLQKESELRQIYHWITKPVLTISRKENLLHAAKKMVKHNISSLVVEENNKPLGIITERDYLKKVVLDEKEPHKYLVEDVMTSFIRFLPEDADVVSAYELMRKYHIRRFPVVNRNGELTGIITQHDILRAMVQIVKHLDWKLVRTRIVLSEFQKQLEDVDVV